jgi:transposase
VEIVIAVRRFCCADLACAAATFAEQVPGLTSFYQRCSQGLRSWAETAALELGGRAGARLAAASGAASSRHTLIRLVRARPGPEVGEVTVLGVDDVAIRRGQSYATVLVNMDSREVIDLLPGRDGDAFEAWLREHPGIKVICRDRGTAYARAARAAAPGAIQVADRFHLHQNLAAAIEKTVAALLPALEPEPQSGPGGHRDSHGKDRKLPARYRERHAAVRELRAEGLSNTQIAARLGLGKDTVGRYANADSPGELMARASRRASVLDPWKPYLHKRWNEGETNATVLDKEIRDQGWKGSLNVVQRYLRQYRTADGRDRYQGRPRHSAPTVTFPKPRQAARWLMTAPGNLRPADAAALTGILAASPGLTAARSLVLAFSDMTAGLRGQYLDDWITAARDSGLPALATFADGLQRDYDAVRNGLTLPWSSGAVEGNNCKFKHIKRIMYGRANFDLLRKMALCN